MNILAMLWGKTTGVIVGAIAILGALAGIRRTIRKGAKDEMSAEIRERTLEQIARAEEAEREIDDMSHDDILEQLRDQGHVRD